MSLHESPVCFLSLEEICAEQPHGAEIRWAVSLWMGNSAAFHPVLYISERGVKGA